MVCSLRCITSVGSPVTSYMADNTRMVSLSLYNRASSVVGSLHGDVENVRVVERRWFTDDDEESRVVESLPTTRLVELAVADCMEWEEVVEIPAEDNPTSPLRVIACRDDVTLL